MERKDLLEANGAIFTVQGKALADDAADDVRVLVVGNPANTNCLIAMNNAPDLDPRALHRHDPPRPQPGQGAARGQDRRARSPTSPSMTIWGNHSATQYPDVFHAEVDGKNAAERRRRPGLDRGRLHPDRAAARRRDHRGPRRCRRRRRPPTPPSTTCTTGCSAPPTGDWVSMAVCSDGSYGVPEGLISSFPCTLHGGE